MVFCNFSNIRNIDKIEDINVLENMEKGLVDLLNQIQIEKVGVSFKLFILILLFFNCEQKKHNPFFMFWKNDIAFYYK